ncbi:TPA: hypothetical protein ACX3MK_004178 [Raoultella ornithinolytica]
MTSKLTSDERLVKILSETQATIMEHNSRCVRGSVEVDARLFESMIMELQERRKAAMDSEPVAWTWHYREQWHVTNDEGRARDLAWDGVKVEPLYRHAQPAVVSEKIIDNFEEEFRRAFEVSAAVEQLIEIGYQGDKFSLSIRDAATLWKLGRTAMLNGGKP